MDDGPARERSLEFQVAEWIKAAQAYRELALELAEELHLHCDDPTHVEQILALSASAKNNSQIENDAAVEGVADVISFTGVRPDSQTRAWQLAQARNAIAAYQHFMNSNSQIEETDG